MKPDFSKYIDIPFKHRGRNFSGCDCFGLVRLIYRQEQNIILPDYLEIDYNCDLTIKKEEHIQKIYTQHIEQGWKVVSKPFDRWDALIFYSNPKRTVADHIGLFIGDGKFIHTSLHYGISMVSKLKGIWESKLYGAARWAGTKQNPKGVYSGKS